MFKSVRIELNAAGVRSLLQSSDVQADLQGRAERIAAAAGGAPDFVAESRVGATRARASVRTATFDGMRAEATDRVLSRALDAGR